jgi:hypothetical protein
MAEMSAGDPKPASGVNYDVAMRRLVYLAGLGCLVILAYSLATPADAPRVASVGVMAGGAALLGGGLLGFLFGVPHSRDSAANEVHREGAGSPNIEVDSATIPPATSYRHNTSLEQISDWLTKILVGVGLVEIKSISAHVWEVAVALRKSLGVTDGAEGFIVALLIYFSSCSFIFGFLWSRLYLLRWFREVDLQALGERISEIERRQLNDAKALALVNQQLNRAGDDPEASDHQIAEAIKSASTGARIQIFEQAKKISEAYDAEDRDLKIETVVAVMRALVASDVKERYHSNRAELSYALSRQKPPDLKAAEQQISKAIEIRDRQRLKGWKYYEMRRALYRILQDSNFRNGAPSDNAWREEILKDLRVAHGQSEKWTGWLDSQPDTKKWIGINNVDVATM